ncbi:MAG: DNA-J related domain-containing protein [Pseudomonadota bacterium]|nr:DNA-J related domain-containing protein [Pseudomonadota bacterium]
MTELIEHIIDELAELLIDGEPRSEYELICALRANDTADETTADAPAFDAQTLSDPQQLFRANFMVMHGLYQLRQRWWQSGIGTLNISALRCQLVPNPTQPADSATQTTAQKAAPQESTTQSETPSDTAHPAEHDPLAAYYLDLANLDISTDDIEALLNQFWTTYLSGSTQPDDLAILNLEAPVTMLEIRRQYRRLAAQHHPDKGGDAATFCELQGAYERLKQSAQNSVVS